jgi:DUF1680 family protein
MFLAPSAGTTVRFAITTSGAGGEQQINGAANLPTGSWVHVAVTLAGATGTLYVNGAQVGQNTTMTLKPSSLGSTTLNYLGKSQYADPNLTGQLDDFRIYNGALTAAEVSALYTSGPTPTAGPTATRTNTPTPGPTATPTNTPPAGSTNLALNPGTILSTSFVSGWENLNAINDGVTPANSADHSHGAYGNWSSTGTNWIQYDFNQSVSVSSVAVYWWNDGGGIAFPTSSSVQYWNGSSYVNVQNAVGNGVAGNQFNTTTFTPVTTTRIRLNMTNATSSTGVLEFQVWGVGVGPTTTPTNTATPNPTAAPGAYLSLMYPESGWKVNNTFWSERIKKVICNEIPVYYNRLNNAAEASGGMDNFVQAQRKMAGLSFKAHVGYWFSNAYPHNVLQAMCRARMVDPQGDTEIINAQNAMLTQINNWIPIILAAREPDGYLHTWTTLGNNARWTDHAAHEGYTAGYFIEAAIAHYQMTNFTDPILFDAAKKLADCWFNNIGPAPKRTWYDGHEEMEQALTRFSRFCGALGDSTRAANYASLAKFLIDSRGPGGSDYDQTTLKPVNQTTAVGHAVRAMYLYSGMTDVAMLHNNSAYFTAVNAIWDNFVNRKYYVTGGVGSGATSEGFGPDYALPNNSYCETCAGCGNLFFQHMMHLAYADGKYMDLAEEVLYNNIVGTMDLGGTNYEYTNPLDESAALRTAWVTNVPCCAGNYPRVILTMPSWMYSKRVGGSGNALYVNLFVGSVVTFNNVFGSTGVTLTQVTNYPWDGTVTLTVSPTTPTAFTLYVRSPQRSVSTLYTHTPSSDGITSMTVNGGSVSTTPTNGYVAINRTWTAGDQVSFTLPLNVQRIKAISNVAADVGRVALQRGPIIFNIEGVDNGNVDPTTLILPPANPLTATWDAALLGGVYKITGNFTTRALLAIPWYKRYNRGGRSIVWMKDA